MNGAEYIAHFLKAAGCRHVFGLTGGACAFMIDAVERCDGIEFVAFQHEQTAAMAADAVWRTSRTVGVSMATSGPGATNLLTGIACSYFDSIPSVHITGQVNLREAADFMGAALRQGGFQETNIVEMARPVTKYAVQVKSTKQLVEELPRAFAIALRGRRGPVLIDVPMNVQQEQVNESFQGLSADVSQPPGNAEGVADAVSKFFAGSKRPLILLGAGVGLAGADQDVAAWLEKSEIPFVSSWNGASSFSHAHPFYCGNIGVYGNRGANTLVQNCDALLVLGSRLDNRQRSGNADRFAESARVHVLDIDGEELKKYKSNRYSSSQYDLAFFRDIAAAIAIPAQDSGWVKYWRQVKSKFFNKDISLFSSAHKSLSPYQCFERLSQCIDDDAVVIGDTGATVCWLYQSFFRTQQTLFTAGGNSPMGYSLPAAIGTALSTKNKQIISVSGDGGFHLNIQDLYTVRRLGLDITMLVMNNTGYGIIKQFQDTYLGSRHAATDQTDVQLDFAAISKAYGIEHHLITHIDQFTPDLIARPGAKIIECRIHPETAIEPKLEMGRPINDQFPYLTDEEFNSLNAFAPPRREKPL